jgi:hypothetical protein
VLIKINYLNTMLPVRTKYILVQNVRVEGTTLALDVPAMEKLLAPLAMLRAWQNVAIVEVVGELAAKLVMVRACVTEKEPVVPVVVQVRFVAHITSQKPVLYVKVLGGKKIILVRFATGLKELNVPPVMDIKM